MNHNESRGNTFFKKKRYSDALKCYYRAIGQPENPSPEMFIKAIECLQEIYNAKHEKVETTNDKISIIEELVKRANEIAKNGVAIYPQEGRLWAILARGLASVDRSITTPFTATDAENIDRDIATLFTASENFVRYYKEIPKDDVNNIFSKVLFFGGLEICLLAADKVLRSTEPFCRIEWGENALAKILATFGPSICPIDIIQRFVFAWYLDINHLYSETWDEGAGSGSRERLYILLLKRAGIREQVLKLPEFSSPYLDGLAIIFKIMVNCFNNNYSTVKKILEDSVGRQDLAPDIKFYIQLMAERIADYVKSELEIGKDFNVDFSSFAPEISGKEKKKETQQHQKQREDMGEYRQFLTDLKNGIYPTEDLFHDEILDFSFLAKLIKGDRKKCWNDIFNCLKASDPEGAIRLLKAFLDKQDDIIKIFLQPEEEVLFALQYSLKRYEEGKETANLIIKRRKMINNATKKEIFGEDGKSYNDELRPLEIEIDEVLSFEPKEDESIISHRTAKEQALAGFEGLKAYIKQYPYAVRDIVKEYVKDPRRASDEVNSFIDYLFLRGTEYLCLEDVDEGVEKILNFINIHRDDLRKEIPKANFDKAWKIIAIIKKIGAVIGTSSLLDLFRNTLDSDEDFKDLIADELIKKDWYQNEDLKKEHQAFLTWITLGKLGLSHFSYLFSEIVPDKPSIKKKKKIAKPSNISISDEEIAKHTKEPIDGWSFFISTGPDSDEQIIEPTDNAFNKYFSNNLVIKGEDVLDKLSYLLMLEPYQRSFLPGIEVIYEGYRKLKRGAARIFWKIDNQNKELHFFVKNRKEAYEK